MFRCPTQHAGLLFLTLTLLTFMVPAVNAELTQAEQRPGEIPVFVFNVSPNGYPPYVILGDDGRHSGIAWDVLQTITERLGYRIEAKKIPRKRVDNLLNDGLIDGTLRAREWTDEPENFTFTQPIVRIKEVFFTRSASGFDYQVPDDIRDMTIVTHLGYQYPELEPLFVRGDAERFDVSQDTDLFTFLLNADHFDAAIADLSVGQWIIRQNGWRGQLAHTDKGISDYGFRLMLREDWTGFADAFNRELAQLRTSGQLELILDRYR
ncbi:substrate-binding periplasmic protein [Marinobacter caseinilyticus]|uniref:substrate-binding periplasmic protein n=1 Tax=Marinobacter caseinilyticus TaxID=2692195 RepID=UPI00140C64D1|nr:transporter substrate-binding domain-containing protein [Marinobacter caseinilyticus]